MSPKKFLPLLTLTTLFAACHSTQDLTCGTSATSAETAADAAYKQKVIANAQTAPCITAHAKVTLTSGGKDLSCSGTLRMKRDDVIQLSLSVLGFEVGRLECTQDGVLIVDRYNKQYVRAGYAQVSFLAQAGLDFHALQALFWDELFAPGAADVSAQLPRFRLSSAGDHTLLALTDAPRLEYDFLTLTASGVVDRLTVFGKNTSDKGTFTFRYGNFTTFNGKPFPQQMDLSIVDTGRDVSLSLALSRLGTKSDWATRTEVGAKYKQRSAEEILRHLSSLGN